ncbi:MAG TPA: hypothetical protein VMH00_05835 [Candidatus Limnocylindrales bacterium]|nr:hypothetical protein [Candidatus Limnocylindrales bacterium]
MRESSDASTGPNIDCGAVAVDGAERKLGGAHGDRDGRSHKIARAILALSLAINFTDNGSAKRGSERS